MQYSTTTTCHDEEDYYSYYDLVGVVGVVPPNYYQIHPVLEIINLRDEDPSYSVLIYHDGYYDEDDDEEFRDDEVDENEHDEDNDAVAE
mmetsp:Transcript_26575/g.37341  ORF Transcript_26575/g.37341 Transcript_26575/m.37341 type:complete len:89 (-) Transcript_26575:583-849(-)